MPPKVSIIVPCYNEQSTIRLLLDALLEQTFPRSEMEVIIADGLSRDGTREAISAFQTDYPDLEVLVVDNPRRSIPSAVNCAIQNSHGEFIVRLDAHSKPYPDYVQNCVDALETGRGDTIGGVWEIHPGAPTWIARSIAVAAAHPLGVGDAFYRHTKVAAEVDTVPFGSFRRSLVERVGYFDESLLTNEDYEFYVRVRNAGGRIWLDPAIRSVYFARSTLGQLARQYRRYGFWKWRMLRRYPKTLRWRQALPPLFVCSVILLGFASIFIPQLGILLALELLLYFSIVLYAGLRASLRQRKAYLLPGLLLTIPIMHVSWGGGFLWSIITAGFQKYG